MRAVRYQVEQAAAADVAVLIRGENGVGKDLIARALHGVSRRCRGPFIRVTCGGFAPELLEGDLFGHEAGAFSDCHRRRGRIERAHGGTLLLDEVGDLPPFVQTKVFRFLQDAQVIRRGGIDPIKVDVRVVALTSRKLETAVRRGDFREDLFYRLNVVTIEVPPLRQRRHEIPILARMFLHQFNTEFGRDVTLAPPTIPRLQAHDWPGNVRELRQLIRRLVMLNRGVLHEEDFAVDGRVPDPEKVAEPRRAVSGPATSLPLKEIARRAARDAERAVINDALERCQGNRAQAARLLALSYKALLYKMAQCGLTRRVIP